MVIYIDYCKCEFNNIDKYKFSHALKCKMLIHYILSQYYTCLLLFNIHTYY